MIQRVLTNSDFYGNFVLSKDSELIKKIDFYEQLFGCSFFMSIIASGNLPGAVFIFKFIETFPTYMYTYCMTLKCAVRWHRKRQRRQGDFT